MATATLSEFIAPASNSLAGKVALITGASRGIGRAIALELANRGATVAINCRSNLIGAEEVREIIQQIGSPSEIFPANISDKLEARRVVQDVLDAYERIDILVNNAGITRDRSIHKMTDEDWIDVIDTNLNGAFYCTSAVIPSMIKQKFGRIVSVASFVGQAGNFGQANYAASKGGPHCIHKGSGPGTGKIQHHCKRGCARIHGNRHVKRDPPRPAGADPG